MKFTAKKNPNNRSGFTLAEVLAAMLFMAIVIPVAVQALRIASLAGTVAERKAQAARIAERVLNEALISSNVITSTQTGSITEGTREFEYHVKVEPWSQHLTNQQPVRGSSLGQLTATQPAVDQLAVSQISMNLLTVQVLYSVQGREYAVQLDTLMPTQ